MPALVDGAAGLAVMRGGKIFLVVRFPIANGRIREMSAVADPEEISALDVSMLEA